LLSKLLFFTCVSIWPSIILLGRKLIIVQLKKSPLLVVLLVLSTSICHYAQATCRNVEARMTFLSKPTFACTFPLQLYPTCWKQCKSIWRCKHHGKLECKTMHRVQLTQSSKLVPLIGAFLTCSTQPVHRLQASFYDIPTGSPQ
jgi:hypothetical protein